MASQNVLIVGDANARAGPTPHKRRVMKIMAITAIVSLVLFAILTGVLIAITFTTNKASGSNAADVAGGVFLILFCLSLVFAIIVAILRCTPWYRGSKGSARKATAADVEAAQMSSAYPPVAVQQNVV